MEGMSGGGQQSGGSTSTMSVAGPSMNAGSVNSGPSINHESTTNPNEGFSSKGLSIFKDFSTNASSPMIDINNGRGEKSSFAKSASLKSEKSIFDTSKPIKNEPLGEFPKALPDKNPDGHQEKIVDINNGKTQEKPMFKNPESFKPKGMIDITKPYHKQESLDFKSKQTHNQSEVIESEEKPSMQEMHSQKEIVVHPTVPKIEEVSSHETPRPDTEIQTQTETRTEIETQIEVGTNPQTQEHPETRTETKTETEEITKPQPQIETRTETQIEPETHPEVKTETQTKPEVKTATETDTEIAAETVLAPELAKQTRVSLKEAKIAIKKAVKKALNKKEKKTDKEKKKKPKIEEEARELFHNRKNEIEQEKEKKQKDPEVLYFEKDKKVNAYREMVTTLAAQRLREEGSELTGSNLAHAISTNILQGDESEIVEGLQEDLSANNVINEVSKVGKISDNQTLHRVIREITDRYTAIRLSFNKKTDANKEDARQVYGKSLDKVNANVYEDKSKGKLVEEQGGEVVYVPGKVYEGYSVESV